MSEARPYIRPQPARWWSKPPYLAYTLRELTGVAVALYGGVLFVGLVSLWRGEEAYAAFRAFLFSPWSLGLHAVLLAGMIWHVVTWCQILPKTQPRIILGGKLVTQERITAISLVVCGLASLALLGGVLLGVRL